MTDKLGARANQRQQVLFDSNTIPAKTAQQL
jgi:hypothetical protein